MRPHAARVARGLHEALFTYLCGMDLRDWLRLLRENRFAIDPPFWPRAAAITAATVRTAARRRGEDAAFGGAVAETPLLPPLFILGHGRSGTTHLQRLLAQDPRFAFPNLYQVTHPHTFLSTEARLSERVAFWLPRTRHQDAVALAVDAPDEDEMALTLMTRCSPRMAGVFPRHRRQYARYLTFHDTSDEEVARWKAAFVWFLKKVTWKHQRPLILKSPTHTARVQLLLELFPDARFVHIYRHPYAVFQSVMRSTSSARNRNALQCEPPKGAMDQILRRYTEVYDAFFEAQPRIRTDHYHQLSFEDLERDPVGQLQEIYRSLNIPWSGHFDTRLERYLGSIRGYRKNVHPPLDPAVRRRIADVWRRSFETWGYRA